MAITPRKGSLFARLHELRRRRHAQGGRLSPADTAEMIEVKKVLKALRPSSIKARKPARPPRPRGDPNPQNEDEALILSRLRELAAEGRHSVNFWKLIDSAMRSAPDFERRSLYMVPKSRALMYALCSLVRRGIVGRRRPNYFLT